MAKIYPLIAPELLAQLEAIPPSFDGYCHYWPCAVRLRTGGVLDRVTFARGDEWYAMWGDATEPRVDPADVLSATESNLRLPARLANKLYAVGETGMGYVFFTVVLRDGRQLPYSTGNAVDFPALPYGVTTADIADVIPNSGNSEWRHRAPSPQEQGARYEWCLFSV